MKNFAGIKKNRNFARGFVSGKKLKTGCQLVVAEIIPFEPVRIMPA